MALVTGALLTLGTSACSDSSAGAGPVSADAASTTPSAPSATPRTGSSVDSQAFAAALQQPGVTLIDVRTPEEFAAGHLAGAKNVDVNSPTFTAAVETLPKTGVYAIYCHSGNRSGVAMTQLTALGFTHVFDLAGGVTAWTAAGGQLVQ